MHDTETKAQAGQQAVPATSTPATGAKTPHIVHIMRELIATERNFAAQLGLTGGKESPDTSTLPGTREALSLITACRQAPNSPELTTTINQKPVKVTPGTINALSNTAQRICDNSLRALESAPTIDSNPTDLSATIEQTIAWYEQLIEPIQEQFIHHTQAYYNALPDIGKSFELSSSAVTAVQRFPRYVLLLQDMAKHYPPGKDQQKIEDLIAKTKAIANKINESVRHNELALLERRLATLETKLQNGIPKPAHEFIAEAMKCMADIQQNYHTAQQKDSDQITSLVQPLLKRSAALELRMQELAQPTFQSNQKQFRKQAQLLEKKLGKIAEQISGATIDEQLAAITTLSSTLDFAALATVAKFSTTNLLSKTQNLIDKIDKALLRNLNELEKQLTETPDHSTIKKLAETLHKAQTILERSPASYSAAVTEKIRSIGTKLDAALTQQATPPKPTGSKLGRFAQRLIRRVLRERAQPNKTMPPIAEQVTTVKPTTTPHTSAIPVGRSGRQAPQRPLPKTPTSSDSQAFVAELKRATQTRQSLKPIATTPPPVPPRPTWLTQPLKKGQNTPSKSNAPGLDGS